MDIDNIIELYTKKGFGTHKIAQLYNVGHKKISVVLKENGIETKKKGGQKKNFINISDIKTKLYQSNEFDLYAKCRITGELFKDANNKSGVLTKHILELYGDVTIPSNNYQRKKYEQENGVKWFEEYFDIVNVEKRTRRKCNLCDWSTLDVDNKTGCFENHVNDIHNMGISEYLKLFPEEIGLHPSCQRKLTKERELLDSQNYVLCQLCNEKMSTITNTHLKQRHNITIEEYKLKFPNSKIVSSKVSNTLSDNAKIINMNQTPTWTSKGEIEVKEFVESLGFGVVKGKNRKLLEGKEIDLLIDDVKIAIEYNGLYYHTEKMGKNSNYHLNKTIECNMNGYKLLQIFEDEWMKKKDLVKNKIKHILKKSEGEKIGARKILIKEISKDDKKIFLDNYHIQGNDKSSIFIGGYFNDILVGVMTFNSKRNMTKNELFEFELSRYATKSGYIISGLASKMIKFFIKNNNPKSIISFADRRWTLDCDNNLYVNLGFELVSIVKPTYYYYNSKVNKYKRFHKFTFGKNNLKKKFQNIDLNKSESTIMAELGYDKIWDCGLFKYQLRLS